MAHPRAVLAPPTPAPAPWPSASRVFIDAERRPLERSRADTDEPVHARSARLGRSKPGQRQRQWQCDLAQRHLSRHVRHPRGRLVRSDWSRRRGPHKGCERSRSSDRQLDSGAAGTTCLRTAPRLCVRRGIVRRRASLRGHQRLLRAIRGTSCPRSLRARWSAARRRGRCALGFDSTAARTAPRGPLLRLLRAANGRRSKPRASMTASACPWLCRHLLACHRRQGHARRAANVSRTCSADQHAP